MEDKRLKPEIKKTEGKEGYRKDEKRVEEKLKSGKRESKFGFATCFLKGRMDGGSDGWRRIS